MNAISWLSMKKTQYLKTLQHEHYYVQHNRIVTAGMLGCRNYTLLQLRDQIIGQEELSSAPNFGSQIIPHSMGILVKTRCS